MGTISTKCTVCEQSVVDIKCEHCGKRHALTLETTYEVEKVAESLECNSCGGTGLFAEQIRQILNTNSYPALLTEIPPEDHIKQSNVNNSPSLKRSKSCGTCRSCHGCGTISGEREVRIQVGQREIDIDACSCTETGYPLLATTLGALADALHSSKSLNVGKPIVGDPCAELCPRL